MLDPGTGRSQPARGRARLRITRPRCTPRGVSFQNPIAVRPLLMRAVSLLLLRRPLQFSAIDILLNSSFVSYARCTWGTNIQATRSFGTAPCALLVSRTLPTLQTVTACSRATVTCGHAHSISSSPSRTIIRRAIVADLKELLTTPCVDQVAAPPASCTLSIGSEADGAAGQGGLELGKVEEGLLDVMHAHEDDSLVFFGAFSAVCRRFSSLSHACTPPPSVALCLY